MNNFCPIVNLTCSELSREQLLEFYLLAIYVLAEQGFRKIEFSLASSGIFENLTRIESVLIENDIELALGSLVEVEQIAKLKLKQRTQVFAPAFDADVWAACNPYIDYVPGIYSKDDFDEVLAAMPNLSKIKIFPVEANTAEELLQALAAPYRELRDRHDLLCKACDDIGIIITSPRDYQCIRKKILEDTNLRLLFKPEPRDLDELIEYIHQQRPDLSIVLTGFGATAIATPPAAARNDGLNFASRVFKTIHQDWSHGLINLSQARKQMETEIQNLCKKTLSI